MLDGADSDGDADADGVAADVEGFGAGSPDEHEASSAEVRTAATTTAERCDRGRRDIGPSLVPARIGSVAARTGVVDPVGGAGRLSGRPASGVPCP
nr:hypothetical protein GCM10025699_77790 [Microbacterium flavescens]